MSDFANIQKEDLEKLAKDFLPATRATTIGILPEAVKK